MLSAEERCGGAGPGEGEHPVGAFCYVLAGAVTL